MKQRLIGLLCLSSLSACSSIIEGTSQEIMINTNPAGANCSLERQGLSIARIDPTPGAATIKKTKYDIVVKCNKEGYQEATYLNHSGSAGATFGNIVLGVGIGWAVDSAAGADNKYDSPVNITLVPEESGSAKKKSKSNHDKSESGGKWCTIHKSTSHNTDECRSNKKNGKSKNGNGNHGNKTWVRNSEEGKKFTQAEVNALVAKEVKKAKTNWVNQQKKRKSDDSGDLNVLDLASDDDSINVRDKSSADMVALELKLHGIDLDDMDKMFDEQTPDDA